MMVMADQEEVSAVQEEISGQGKCTRQYAQNADKNVKFLLSQQKASQFIAKNAL